MDSLGHNVQEMVPGMAALACRLAGLPPAEAVGLGRRAERAVLARLRGNRRLVKRCRNALHLRPLVWSALWSILRRDRSIVRISECLMGMVEMVCDMEHCPHADGEDAAQDVTLRVVERLESDRELAQSLEDPDQLRAYLWTALRHEIRTVHRGRRREASRMNRLIRRAAPPTWVFSGVNPESTAHSDTDSALWDWKRVNGVRKKLRRGGDAEFRLDVILTGFNPTDTTEWRHFYAGAEPLRKAVSMAALDECQDDLEGSFWTSVRSINWRARQPVSRVLYDDDLAVDIVERSRVFRERRGMKKYKKAVCKLATAELMLFDMYMRDTPLDHIVSEMHKAARPGDGAEDAVAVLSESDRHDVEEEVARLTRRLRLAFPAGYRVPS